MLRSEAWLRDRYQGRLLVPPLDVSLASSSRFSRRETGGTFAWLKSLYLSCPRFWYENNIPPSAFTKGACQVRPMFPTDTLSRRPVARAEKSESGFDPLREPGRRVHGPTGRLHRPRPVPQRAGHLRRLPADRREEHRALEDWLPGSSGEHDEMFCVCPTWSIVGWFRGAASVDRAKCY